MDRIYKVNADELKIGDLIPVNRNETLGIRGDMTLTKEEGFFLGYFIGDGWFNERKNNAGKYFMGVTFGSSLAEQMMAETILKFINNRKKEKSSITRTKGGFDIQTTSIEFAKFLMERFGLKPGVKCIPEIVWKSNDEFIIGFIDGLLSSDGHVSKSTASTKCVDFITSIYVKAGYAYIVDPNDLMRVGSTDITFRLQGLDQESFFHVLENNAGVGMRCFSDQALFSQAPGRSVLITGIVNS